jgi:BlaI family penicillinase repressor
MIDRDKEKETGMANKDRELFDGEWAILKVVWEHEPVTAPTVQECLQKEKNWAYATVKTLMDRMTKKGLLKTDKIRNMYLYRAAISRAQAQESDIVRVVKRAFNGTFSPMMQFLVESEKLSDEEVQYVEDLLKQRKRRKAGSKQS